MLVTLVLVKLSSMEEVLTLRRRLVRVSGTTESLVLSELHLLLMSGWFKNSGKTT